MNQPWAFGCIEGQRVKHAVQVTGRPASPLHGQPRRFVDNQNGVVAIENAALQIGRVGVGHHGMSARLGRTGCLFFFQGGDAHGLALRQPNVGLDPPAIDPDMTFPQQLFQPPMTEPRESFPEPLVQTDAIVAIADFYMLNAAHDRPHRITVNPAKKPIKEKATEATI